MQYQIGKKEAEELNCLCRCNFYKWKNMVLSIFEISEKTVKLGIPKKVELQAIWVELQLKIPYPLS